MGTFRLQIWQFPISNPSEYFENIKKSINKWLENKPRPEFYTQQNIAKSNQSLSDKYVVLDMEYAFEQNQIE